MWLWGAHGVSIFGSLVTRAALPFTAALALHASAAQMALLGAADLIASLIVGLWAGAWVDRVRRKPLLIGCDVARAMLLATIPVAAWTGRLDLTLLLVVKFLAGGFDTLFELARGAFVPGVVGEPRLVEANSRLSATSSVAEVSAFGIAGWLVQWLTGPIAIGVDAISFLVSAFLLGGIRTPERSPMRHAAVATFATWLADMREGLVATFGDPLQRTLAISDAMLNLTFGLFTACYMLFVTRELALSPGPLGMVFAVGGISGLVAAAYAARLGKRLGVGRVMALGLIISSVGLGVATLTPPHAVALALTILVLQQLVGDGGWTLYMIHSSSLRMARAPEALRGRIGSASGSLSVAARLGGIVLGGAFGDGLGSRVVLGVGASITLVAGLGLLRSARGSCFTRTAHS
ncbi:MAG: MFS transporter [Candidatus Eisenbacteria bacterium]